MFDTMYLGDGVGLAANQVGLPFQVFVMNASADRTKTEDEFVFINPVIVKKFGGFEEEEEGCLSFPGIHAVVERPVEIIIEGAGLDGKLQQFKWKGFPARAVQHEFDHLHGTTFIDRLTPMRLYEIQDDLIALEKEFETNRQLKIIPPEDEIAATLEELERKFC